MLPTNRVCTDVINVFSILSVTCADGLVVCHGGNCQAVFSNCHFSACTLTVIDGATANVNNCSFVGNTNGPSGVSIQASGASSTVNITGSSIKGGAQAATVQAGARLTAQSMEVRECYVSGFECRDQGSAMELSGCTVSTFSQQLVDIVDVTGVLVRQQCKATVSQCNLDGIPHGVDVQSGAFATISRCHVTGCSVTGLSVSSEGQVKISDCRVHACGVAGVHVFEGGTFATIMDSSLSHNEQHGLLVSNCGEAEVQRCEMRQNSNVGAFVSFSGVMHVSQCSSSGNTHGGFWAESGTILDLDSAMISLVD